MSLHKELKALSDLRSYEKAIDLYDSAKQGDNNAKIELQQAIDVYQSAATKGNIEAQCCLARCYEDGIGVKEDEQKAVELYQSAALKGNTEAQCYLAQCYEYGDMVEKNAQKAFRLYHLAAMQGRTDAQLEVAESYEYGVGTEENEEEALHFYKLASMNGDPKATRKLAEIFSVGELGKLKVQPDRNEVVRLLYQLFKIQKENEYKNNKPLIATTDPSKEKRHSKNSPVLPFSSNPNSFISTIGKRGEKRKKEINQEQSIYSNSDTHLPENSTKKRMT
jgi:TPR repeat protein